MSDKNKDFPDIIVVQQKHTNRDRQSFSPGQILCIYDCELLTPEIATYTREGSKTVFFINLEDLKKLTTKPVSTEA